MIEVQAVKCPTCGHSFDFSSYIGEEIGDNNVRLTKSSVQRTSWNELDLEIQAGRAGLLLDVGDKLDFEMKDGTKTSIIVAAINPYGNGVVFSFANILKSARMNNRNTNRGGFCKSDMAGMLAEEILPLLPDDLVAVIKSRKITQKQTVSSSSGAKERLFERECKLWLPSYTEVFGYDERYSKCDVRDTRFPLFETRSGRVRYTSDDELSYWWLRSPIIDSSTNFWFVGSYGYSYYGYASNADGVCPCFSI